MVFPSGRPRLSDVFRIQVISNAQVRSPILTLGSTTFSHVKHENIYIVAVTKSNANAALVFEFLYRLIALGKSYFGKFDEEAVKNNFVLIYELLDGTFSLLVFYPVEVSDDGNCGMKQAELDRGELLTVDAASRDLGFWISTKHGNRHIKDVYHN